MKLYLCKVYDDGVGDWADLGVFSTQVKAECAGIIYIHQIYHDVELIDWEREPNVYTDWYQTPGGRVFTRVITECELDKSL